MTWSLLTIIQACRTEDLEHIYTLKNSDGDLVSQLTPYIDRIFDPSDLGFDTSVSCYIEEDPDMEYKKRLFLEGNIWVERHRLNWSQPIEYNSYFISDVDGVVHQGLYNTSSSALFPIFWDRLSYGEHVVAFIAFNKEDGEPVCISKYTLWSDYEE